MAEPLTAAAVEVDLQYVYEDSDGQTFDHYDVTFTRDNWEKIRVGKACLRCWEVQDHEFLRSSGGFVKDRREEKHLPGCPYVGDGIRVRQAADVAKEFDGEKWIGPKQKLEDTIAEDDERRLKYRVDTGNVAGPFVPHWVKL